MPLRSKISTKGIYQHVDIMPNYRNHNQAVGYNDDRSTYDFITE